METVYYAVSLALVGDKWYATCILLLELALNVDFYSNHPKFTQSLPPPYGCHPNTIFSLCLTEVATRFSTTVIKIWLWLSCQRHILLQTKRMEWIVSGVRVVNSFNEACNLLLPQLSVLDMGFCAFIVYP